MASFEIRRVSAETTRPLRQRVLRPHQRPEELVYPLDDAPETFHAAGFLDGALVGVASIYRVAEKGERNPDAWQLRGMATAPETRGAGYGALLLDRCVEHARAHGATKIWCNARISAEGFYRRLGFVVKGDVFELPGIGPHCVMWKAP